MPEFDSAVGRPAAVTAAVLLSVILAFLAYWSLGGSRGLGAHWGGRYSELPSGLRAADAVSAAVFAFGAFSVLGVAVFDSPGPSSGFFRAVTWALVAVLGISGLMNLASSSSWERFLLGPLALILAALCFIVARSA